jgi:chitodextrinase
MTHCRFATALCLLLLGGLPVTSHAQSAWNSLTLNWTAPGDDSLAGRAAQYDLRYSTATITAANFSSATRLTGMAAPAVVGTTETATVTGLSPGTTYYFAIKAGDDAGNWALISNVVSKATSAAPDTVRPAAASVAVSAVTDTTATLAWSAVGDDSLTGTATSYQIRYSTSAITAANFASASVVTPPTPAAPGTAQNVIVRGLSRQVTYYFALRTVDEAGNVSALSNVPTATTTDTTAPGKVNDLRTLFVWASLHLDLTSPLREVLP